MVVKNVSQSILNPRSKMSTRLLGNQQVSLSFVGTVIHTSQGGQLGLFLPCLLAHLYPAEHGSLTKVSSRARSAPEQAELSTHLTDLQARSTGYSLHHHPKLSKSCQVQFTIHPHFNLQH